MRARCIADARSYTYIDCPHALWTCTARAPRAWRTGLQRKVRLLQVPASFSGGCAWLKSMDAQVATRCTAPPLGALQQVSQKDRDAPSRPLTITAKLISSIEQACTGMICCRAHSRCTQ